MRNTSSVSAKVSSRRVVVDDPGERAWRRRSRRVVSARDATSRDAASATADRVTWSPVPGVAARP
ncbi:MAG: hypothetical protein R2713_05480 [Ilumatobacteraceae bacterium]